MKKTILLIGGIVAALVGISAISKRNKEKEETELPPIAEPPKVENQKPLDPLSGEGLKAINTRMKSLHNSSYKGELLSNMDSNWYGGLDWKTDFQQFVQGEFGDAYPIDLVKLDSNYLKFLESIYSQTDLVTDGNYDKDLARWGSISKYKDIDLFPSSLRPKYIENGLFKSSGDGDRNRSERYSSFAADLMTFANNLTAINKSYEQNLRNQAISDLIASGYKFIGY